MYIYVDDMSNDGITPNVHKYIYSVCVRSAHVHDENTNYNTECTCIQYARIPTCVYNNYIYGIVITCHHVYQKRVPTK